MGFLDAINRNVSAGRLPEALGEGLQEFYESYSLALKENGKKIDMEEPLLCQFLDFVIEQLRAPFAFEPYHQQITSPFDYYRFGLDFIRPLIIFESSRLLNSKNIDLICRQLEAKDNVILLANHQTEPDPQVISLMLEDGYPELAKNMIFVAGHRVISDPLAVPFSMGRNLLCIFSKKHIEGLPLEEREKRLQHNQKTMRKMGQLLAEGGKCIYVAPSGGRDRPNPQNIVEVVPFDPQSIEMFWLIAKNAKRLTHFYPLALDTYRLLPPPNSVDRELGEKRYARCVPVHLSFGPEIDMVNFPGALSDKRQNRKARADYIWGLVNDDYQNFF